MQRRLASLKGLPVVSIWSLFFVLPLFIPQPLALAEGKVSEKAGLRESSFASKALPILGQAKYKYLFWSVFEAKLFANSETIEQESDILGNIPKRLELKYLRDFSAKDMVKEAYKFFESHDKTFPKEFHKELAQLDRSYKDVKKGDQYALEFIPGSGLTLSLNGKFVTKIEGDELANRYLAIWLSANSRISGLLPELLGNSE